jgi:hypothetical protein
MVSERDLVQRRKIYHPIPDENSYLIHFKSVEHTSCPVQKELVRANTFISGYYIKTIQTNPLTSVVCTLSKTDIGGSIPQFIINKLSVNAPQTWTTNLISGLESLYGKKMK